MIEGKELTVLRAIDPDTADATGNAVAGAGLLFWLVVFAVGFVLYGASYAHLRFTRVLVHRAGKYDFVDRHGTRHKGRHLIQMGSLREGNEVFAEAVLASGDSIGGRLWKRASNG